MPSPATERNDPHGASQLETLLWELLDKESPENPHADVEAPRGIAELREMARRLRAVSQRVPLPEGRLAVRRALMVTAEESQNRAGLGRASWRRAGLWLSMAAMVAVVGAFSLGAGALDVLVPPSSPVYGVRLVLDNARGTFGLGHPGVGQYALSYQFSPVQMPSAASVTRTAEGRVGGLPATLTLTGVDACATGGACGRFVVSLASLSTLASAQFGEMTGTFACASGRCTLALDKATGVFAKVSGPLPSVSGSGVSAGQLGTKFASLGEWVAMVASAAETLDASGMLPAGLTVGELVNDAATSEKSMRHNDTPNGGGKRGAPSLVNPGGKQGSQTSSADDKASESRGASRVGTSSGPRIDAGAAVHNHMDIGRRASSQIDHGGSTLHNSTAGGSTGSGVPSSGPTIHNYIDGNVSKNHQSAGPNGHGGTNVDDGVDVSGGASFGNGSVDAAGGVNINGGVSTGSGGGINAGGGASVSGGVSTGSGGVSAGTGASVSGGVSAGSGGVSIGAGASVSGGVSAGAGGVNAGAGASVSGGVSAGSGGVNVGAGASVSGGASAGKPGSTSGSGGVSVGGGVSVNAGSGGVGIGAGVSVGGIGINISGGSSGNGSGSGNGSHDAGSGSH